MDGGQSGSVAGKTFVEFLGMVGEASFRRWLVEGDLSAPFKGHSGPKRLLMDHVEGKGVAFQFSVMRRY